MSYYPPPAKSNKTGWIVAGAIAGLLLLVIGIGLTAIAVTTIHNHNKPTPSPSVSVSPSPSAEPSAEPTPSESTPPTINAYGAPRVSSSDEQSLITVVHNKGYFLNASDSAILSAGYEVCNLFDRGESFTAVYNAMTSAGIDSSGAAYLMGASVGALCPRNKGSIK